MQTDKKKIPSSDLSPGDPPLSPTHIVPKSVLQDRTTGFSSKNKSRLGQITRDQNEREKGGLVRDSTDDDENRELNGHPDDEIKRQRTQYNGDQLYSNLWPSKWSIKEEHKLLSELNSGGGNGNSPYYDGQTFPSSTTATDIYDSMQQTGPVYTPPIAPSLGGSLTPLAPITMQEIKLDTSISPYNQENSGGYGTPVEAADPPHAGGSPDPGLTTLQPGSASPYTMLPTFTHYATGSGGVSDYGYTGAYSQYTTSPYSTYSYPTGSTGLLSSPYYYMNGSQANQNQGNIEGNSEVMSRSPLAATRANSGASASSPTDSACQEKPQMSSAGMFIG
ncbi:hypothetical protein RUM43_001336 [Polyplax serrata]|uniref:Uncharacterized protein n=1 Tax=Polyplax serrata TaxID=468196 RepID=A0AAN8SDX3_POLSC